MPLSKELTEELKESFQEFAQNGVLTGEQLGQVFKAAGESIPSFKIRDFYESNKKGRDDPLNFEEFIKLFDSLNLNKTWGSKLRDNVQSIKGVKQFEGSSKSGEGTVHTLSDSEKRGFSNYISGLMSVDNDVKSKFPIDPESDQLFECLGDGIVLCKLVNWAQSETIDERAINKKGLNPFKINENLTLAITSCSAIGCQVVNVSAQDFVEKRPHLILGLIWQVIRIGLLQKINLKDNPNLAVLLREGETIEALMALSADELLIRWVNYHLERAGSDRVMTNFGSDLKDSVIYATLMGQIMKDNLTVEPGVITSNPELHKRATMVVKNVEGAGIPALLTADDIIKSNQKLNLALMAELFNTFPCLEKAEIVVIEETREEKTYRNWMNSLGTKPPVQYLYNDLRDGLVLLNLLDKISPGCVQWDKVNQRPFKASTENFKKLENCNRAVEVAKALKFSLVGIAGDDILNCSKTLVLSIVSQMMKLYTLKLLQELSKSNKPIADAEILAWANEKLSGAGITLSGFKDPAITTSVPISELVEAIRPNSVDRTYVTASASSHEEKLLNAKYVISIARKIGAVVYALPEDVVEAKQRMVMTIFASLMIVDLKGK